MTKIFLKENKKYVHFVMSYVVYTFIFCSISCIYLESTFDFKIEPVCYFFISIVILTLAKFFATKARVLMCLAFLLILLFIGYSQDNVFIIGEGYLLVRLLLVIKHIHAFGFISFLDGLNYIFYFPLAVSGPYISVESFVEQFNKKTYISRYRFNKSLYLCGLGSIKFTILATMFGTIARNYTDYFQTNLNVLYLFITGSAYYFMIYFSFSGLSQISRGISGLMGIQVPRNFKNPVASKNLQEHWRRWHVTFLDILRENIFIPVVVILQRKSARGIHVYVCIGIGAVFIAMAIWQGARLQYFLFSIWHASGLIISYLYGVYVTKYIYKLSNTHIYYFVSWFLTYCYIACGYYIFFTDSAQLRELLRLLGGIL